MISPLSLFAVGSCEWSGLLLGHACGGSAGGSCFCQLPGQFIAYSWPAVQQHKPMDPVSVVFLFLAQPELQVLHPIDT